MTTTTPPSERELYEALQQRLEVRDDYARRLEEAVKNWESLDESPQSLMDLNDTVVAADTTKNVPWPTRAPRVEPPLHEVLAVLPDAVILLNAAGAVRHWNAAAEVLFGWLAFEVIGQPPPFLGAAHHAEHAEILDATRRDSPIRERIVSRRGKDGKSRSLMLVARALPSGDVALIFRPAAMPKPPAPEPATSPKLEALGRMMAAVSHDFNNVLLAIGGSADLLADRIPLHSPDREWVEVIRTASRHAGGLTRRLIQYAKPSPMSPASTDLSAIVEGLLPLVKALVPNGVRVKVQTEPHLPATSADATAIEQVVLNLATNAGQAMPRGGALQIRTALQILDGKPHVMLAVADSGGGMDETTRLRLFDPYFTTRADGTGLGLPIVRDAVTQAGGKIEVDSLPGLGSVFRIYFPALPPIPPSIDGRGQRALVVDDDPGVRELMKRTLESVGFDVSEAGTGEEALLAARWSREEIDLLVTDVVMPAPGGRKLLEKLRAGDPSLAAVIVSGYPPVCAEMLPGTLFLEKPFSAKQLLAAVKAVLPVARR